MLNKVMLIGNLGADPDNRYMPSGKAVTNISVATSKRWKDRDSGEQKEATEWHKVAAFGRLAEVMAEYLRKGSKVYIEGSLRTRKWQDQQGNDRWTTEIICDQMTMLDTRRQGAASQQPSESYTPPSSGKTDGPYTDTDFDDDIPF